jgi:dTDP-4-amino-4,6-dideoxygalactose transaminase
VEALRIAVDALGLEKGSGIVVSALSPSYYRFAIEDRGFVPLIADTLPASGAIDPQAMAAFARAGAKAAIVFGAYGILPGFDALAEAGIPIIEDISMTVGGYSSLRKAGDSGLVSVMSLEAGTAITSGEGALVFAKGKREAAAVRSGIERLPREMLMSDMNASLGYAQLKELPRFLEKRKELYGLFQRALLQSRHSLLAQEGEGESAYFSFPVVLRSGAKDVRAYAKKKDIETDEAAAGTILEAMPEGDDSCPQARSLALRCVLFPLHPRIGKTAAQRIVKVLATLP